MDKLTDKEKELLTECFDKLYKEPPFIRTTSWLRLEIPEWLTLPYFLEYRTREWVEFERFGLDNNLTSRHSFDLFMSSFDYDRLTLIKAVNKSLTYGTGVALTNTRVYPIEEDMSKVTLSYEKDNDRNTFGFQFVPEDVYKFRPKDVDKHLPASVCELIILPQTKNLNVRWPEYMVARSKPFSPQDLIDVIDQLSEEAQGIIISYLPVFANS